MNFKRVRKTSKKISKKYADNWTAPAYLVELRKFDKHRNRVYDCILDGLTSESGLEATNFDDEV